MRVFQLWVLIGAPWVAVASAAQDESEVKFSEAEIRRILQHELQPLPADPTNRFADNPPAAHFGQFLFFEKRFSANGEVSCATCHEPTRAFTDGKSLGSALGEMTRHTPTLLNVAHNRWLFWDGRADTLWAQALNPFEDPREFDSNRLRIAHAMFDNDDLRTSYEFIFGPLPDFTDAVRFPRDARPVSQSPEHPHSRAWLSMSDEDRTAVNHVFVNVAKAIAAYERRLVTGPSPFDEFADGLKHNDPKRQRAITSAAKRGLKIFVGRGNCRLCHSGPNFSDGEFHNTGIPPLRGDMPRDPGRFEGAQKVILDPFNATGEYSDDRTGIESEKVQFLANSPETWGQFKTPSLRNVAITPPYMHQGQLASLSDVLQFYSTLEGAVQAGHHQETILVPLNLSDREIGDLEEFLGTLRGEPVNESLLRQPESPVFNEQVGEIGN